MKIRFLYLLLFVFIASCSSDDDAIRNQPPGSFSLSQMPDQSTNVDFQPSFSWQDATDPDDDNVKYDFYLDTDNPPTMLVAANLNSAMYDLEEELEPATTYYWKVVAKDSEGNETESTIFSFTTRSLSTSELLVGKWYLESRIVGGVEEAFSDCQKNGFYHFLSTGDLIIEMYSLSWDVCEMNANIAATYEVLPEDVIQAYEEDETAFFDIVSISQTELTLSGGGEIVNFTKR